MYNSCNNVKRKHASEGGFMYGTTHKPTFKHHYGHLIPCILRLNDGVDIHSYMYVYTLDHAISFLCPSLEEGGHPHPSRLCVTTTRHLQVESIHWKPFLYDSVVWFKNHKSVTTLVTHLVNPSTQVHDLGKVEGFEL